MRRREDLERTIRAVAEHVERTRRLISDGQATIDSLHESVEQTNKHLASMAEWIDETERKLQSRRAR